MTILDFGGAALQVVFSNSTPLGHQFWLVLFIAISNHDITAIMASLLLFNFMAWCAMVIETIDIDIGVYSKMSRSAVKAEQDFSRKC